MITAVIPARSGSKRLPGKNTRLLNGRPLIFHSLDAVLNHAAITKVVFTTESDEYIRLVVNEYGDRVVIEKRPERFASDNAKVYDEVVRLAKNNIIDTDWFMLCLPTAPLRSHATVARLLQAWEIDQHARFSASPYGFPIQFAFDMEANEDWKPIFESSPMLTGDTRSQNIPARYRPNGAIYLHRTDQLKLVKTFYIGAKPFLISDIEGIDVDTPIDFKVAELLMAERDQ